MRTGLVLALCGLISTAAVIAQDLPIPTALRQAKTVYVVNGGVSQKTLESTAKDLAKWGRFEIVADVERSDITLTLTNQPTKHVYNWAIGAATTVNSMFFSITNTADGTVLYGAQFTGNATKELDKLKKRLEAQ